MKKEKNIDIGSVVIIKVMRDNNIVSEEMYQIEEFYPSFVLCRHIKSGYRECFSPHDLYKAGVVSWNQRIHYNQQIGFACGG